MCVYKVSPYVQKFLFALSIHIWRFQPLVPTQYVILKPYSVKMSQTHTLTLVHNPWKWHYDCSFSPPAPPLPFCPPFKLAIMSMLSCFVASSAFWVWRCFFFPLSLSLWMTAPNRATIFCHSVPFSQQLGYRTHTHTLDTHTHTHKNFVHLCLRRGKSILTR